MIDLNLIPASLRKDGGAQARGLSINFPKEVLVGVGVSVVLLLLIVHLILGSIWLMGMGRLSFYNAQWQRVLPQKTAIDDLNKESIDLNNKIKLISGMTVDKNLLWAPKFNAISDALPKGLWIKNMTLDKTGLTIEGSVVSKTANEINNVGLFLSTLKQNNDFMKGFSSLEVNSIQGSKDNSVEVTDFSVVAKLKEDEKNTRSVQ